jgi:putative sensory transduction regulator
LHYYGGRDLMLVAKFPSVSLSAINQWNRGAKFSRAVFYQDKAEDYSTLEANLDIQGGVTDDTIRHFISRYDEELKQFDRLVFGTAAKEEEVVTKVSAARLEKILKDLDIEFKKIPGKEADIDTYELKRDSFKVRLHNFKGEDLMLDAAFKEIPLAEVNKYNLARKFIRVVLYQPARGKKHTSLEANLDCLGGVSDRIIRYFIGTFDGEVREFAKFIAK